MKNSRFLVPCLVCTFASVPASGTPGRTVLSIRGALPDQVRTAFFRIAQPVTGRVDAMAAGTPDSLYAYGWIYDLDRRATVWEMRGRRGDVTPAGIAFAGDLRLEPGRYAAHFFNSGMPHEPRGLLGLLRNRGGQTEPASDTYLALRLAPADALAFSLEDPRYTVTTSELRLAPLGDSARVHQRFRLATPARVTIAFLGEGLHGGTDLADRAWLRELVSGKLVWSAETSELKPAGGSRKNWQSRTEIDLPAAAYELVARTDDSHSFERWNAPPPSSPTDWGVVLAASPPSLHRDGLPEERAIAKLTGAGSDTKVAAVFRLDASATVHLRALGEWSSGAGQLVDSARLERMPDGGTIWEMRNDEAQRAGGHPKNRVVHTSLELGPGTYRVVYETDDSHAMADWNEATPDEPADWGITVSTYDAAARFTLLEWATLETGPRTKKKHRHQQR